MKISPHLLVYISGHGYGHVAQVVPILNQLKQTLPRLQITIKTAVPHTYLSGRIASEFHYISQASDFGMLMASALEVEAEASMSAYVDFHADWDAKVEKEAKHIADIAPDLVLSDVAYLPLAAAAKIDVPSVAMCSLNWADIFRYYCENMLGAAEILQQIEQAYIQSEVFLRLMPAMPMSWLINQRAIGPVAQLGINRRDEINKALGISSQTKLVLASMGGVAMRLPVERWPSLPDVLWLIQADWLKDNSRDDMVAFESFNINFADLFASCDVFLTKPGYGAFVEAACNGVPVLYVRRDDWPEQECLIAWLCRHGLCHELNAVQAQTGDFDQDLQYLLSQPKPQPVRSSGINQATEYLASLLPG